MRIHVSAAATAPLPSHAATARTHCHCPLPLTTATPVGVACGAMCGAWCCRYAAVKYAVLKSLRVLRNRVSTLGIGGRVSFLQQPLFRVYLCFARVGTTLRPSLASVQHAINDVAKRMVLLPRAIHRWRPAVTAKHLGAGAGTGTGMNVDVNMGMGAAMGGSSGGGGSMAGFTAGGGGGTQHHHTFFETFAKSRALLVVVLQLSGTLVGVESRMRVYVERFEKCVGVNGAGAWCGVPWRGVVWCGGAGTGAGAGAGSTVWAVPCVIAPRT